MRPLETRLRKHMNCKDKEACEEVLRDYRGKKTILFGRRGREIGAES